FHGDWVCGRASLADRRDDGHLCVGASWLPTPVFGWSARYAGADLDTNWKPSDTARRLCDDHTLSRADQDACDCRHRAAHERFHLASDCAYELLSHREWLPSADGEWHSDGYRAGAQPGDGAA